MTFKSIDKIDVSGKRVLLRADLNVPKQDGKVADTTRIDRLKPTIDLLRVKNARIIILSHFGRPNGTRDTSLSLAFLVSALEKSWGVPVAFSQDCIGVQAETATQNLGSGGVLLLENLRFHQGEIDNSPEFAAQIARLGDVFVNDAFSVSHRAEASVEALAHLLPSAAGLLMKAELQALELALGNPQKPVAAIVGGSKISTKLAVLYNLTERVDYLILGGGMANTFIHANGGRVGGSLCEKDMKDEALAILHKAESLGCKIILPLDSVCVREIKANALSELYPSHDIPDGFMAIDVGPKTLEHIHAILDECKTVLWNGPMGVFEIKPFDEGTNTLAAHVAGLTRSGGMTSVAGGGDTVAALENAGCAGDFSYISSAGGAFLEWMEGKDLPGVLALRNQV